MRQKLVIFLITGIPYGLLMGPLLGSGWGEIIALGFLAGIMFGLVMTILLTFIQWRFAKKNGIHQKNIKVVNTAEIVAKGTKEELSYSISIQSDPRKPIYHPCA